MHFCFIFRMFAFQSIHSSHFLCHFSQHFLVHSDHSSAKHPKNDPKMKSKMSQKWLLWTTLMISIMMKKSCNLRKSSKINSNWNIIDFHLLLSIQWMKIVWNLSQSTGHMVYSMFLLSLIFNDSNWLNR